MKSRVAAAAALARNAVSFDFQVPDEYAGLDVYARMDLYMWSHLINNLCVSAGDLA